MTATLEVLMPLGDRLKELRTRAGLSQEALAVKAHVTVSALRKIEQGSVPNPSWHTVCAFAKALDASLDELLKTQDGPLAKNLPEIPRKARGPESSSPKKNGDGK